ncbi:MAG TPA: class I SAM-dependent methyltransferase [Rhodocyclaceae bacterium]|nr:class I SAM-dependent methyltransferase [Rhodocyclaceae bacterium]
MSNHAIEISAGERFAFGANWTRFLSVLDDDRVEEAIRSLKGMLGVESLAGLSFIDIGSGSGLFSLAARRLGARVHSFDYDPQSVACTTELRRRYYPGDGEWVVEQGSVLDREYLSRLEQSDVVYSWGVLHHTGNMWQALENVAPLVKSGGGRLFIAIYNDQGGTSRRWAAVKSLYNRAPQPFRFPIALASFVWNWGPEMVKDVLKGRPFESWRNYGAGRGMNPWIDVVDWVGGYPFEVAKPEALFHFFRARGFALENLRTVNNLGCNQLVFTR